jgi:putative hydrolase of the HAD superfamily
MIKLIIFDLDNTLFDTYTQVGKVVLSEMIAEMKKAGLTENQEKILRKRYAYTGFRIIAKQLKLSNLVKKIGMNAYQYMDLSKIKPYRDVRLLRSLPQKKILVTSGIKRVQQSKVDILKIRTYFEKVMVDEGSTLDNKKKIFARLLKQYKMRPEEVLVVGDNPDSEIAAGTALGMVTVQIIRRKGMAQADSDYNIRTLHALKKIISKEDKK